MRYLIGLIIVLVGLQLLLTAAGVSNIPSLDIWWPVILIAIGLISWKSNPHLIFWPFLLIVLGIVFLLSNLDLLPGNAWNYIWPVILILIGLNILSGRRWHHHHTQVNEGKGDNVSAAFSGRKEKVVGDFSHGQIQAWFGGCQYDLRNADIKDNATLEVSASFGGIEILVPRNVQVRLRVTPILGGSENKTEPDSGATKTLTISGTAMCGGVEVKN